ncbi:MAG TPA: cytochrome c [Rhizomicrobium sp.]|jgi:mono/diheme cytochrome c family protein|nr:cytochrome c [Rhizomicrobium sp.]
MRRGLAVLLAFAVASCGQSMSVQHRAESNGQTDAWANGIVVRPLPQGVVALGDGAYRNEVAHPPPASPELLARGRERYDIFCSECHGYTGAGDGMVARRGYPKLPSLLSSEAMNETAGQIFGTITSGKGIMFPYAVQIAPRDRWSIVAYVRALQLSQRAQTNDGDSP